LRPKSLWAEHRVLCDSQWQPHLQMPAQLHPPARHHHRVWERVRARPRLHLRLHLPELPVRAQAGPLRPNPLWSEHPVQREQAGQPSVHLQRRLRTSSRYDHWLFKDCRANSASRSVRSQPLRTKHPLRGELWREPCVQVHLRLRPQPRHHLRMQREA